MCIRQNLKSLTFLVQCKSQGCKSKVMPPQLKLCCWRSCVVAEHIRWKSSFLFHVTYAYIQPLVTQVELRRSQRPRSPQSCPPQTCWKRAQKPDAVHSQKHSTKAKHGSTPHLHSRHKYLQTYHSTWKNNEGKCENTGKLRCAMSVASEKMSALRQGLERSTGFPVYVQQQFGPDSEHMAGAWRF